MNYLTKIVDNIPLGTIAPSPIHGYGLFAVVDIPKGTILCKLDGQIISWEKYEEIVAFFAPKVSDLKDYFFMEWNAISEDMLLVRPFRTKYSFINHSRTPNLKILRETMTVVAIQNIKAGQELLLDYRDEPLNEKYINEHGKTCFI